MKIVSKGETSVKIKSNCQESNKHLPKITGTKCSTEITTQKAGKYLKVAERKTRVYMLSYLLT